MSEKKMTKESLHKSAERIAAGMLELRKQKENLDYTEQDLESLTEKFYMAGLENNGLNR